MILQSRYSKLYPKLFKIFSESGCIETGVIMEKLLRNTKKIFLHRILRYF